MRPILRARNRWQHLRQMAIFQLEILERENVVPKHVAEKLREAVYAAEDELTQTVFAGIDEQVELRHARR